MYAVRLSAVPQFPHKDSGARDAEAKHQGQADACMQSCKRDMKGGEGKYTLRVVWGRGHEGAPGEAGGAAGPFRLTGVPGAGVVMGLLVSEETGAT